MEKYAGTEPFIQDKVTRVPTDKQLLDMLEKGRISAAVMILNDALNVVLNNPGHYQNIGIANPYLETLNLFYYINKKNVNLYEKVTSGIETVVDNGYAQKTCDDAILKHKEILRKLIIE